MFKSSYIPRWVGFKDRKWTGTENSDLIQPILGAPYPNDYPFKKYYLESNAPIYEDAPNFAFGGPPNSDVSIKMAIQKGNLYDMSKIERSRTKPLLVVKLLTGEYNIITFNQNLILTEKELEGYRVPITINGVEMKQIDFSKKTSIDAATLTTRVHFDAVGSPLPEAAEFTYGRGQVYLLIKKQANPDGTPVNPANYSRILGAEIATFDQLVAKNAFEKRGGNWVIKEGPPYYMKDKVSIVMMESYRHARYAGIGSISELVFGKGASFDFEDSSPLLYEEYQDSISSAARYKQVFQFQNGHNAFADENFNDHFFCRV